MIEIIATVVLAVAAVAILVTVVGGRSRAKASAATAPVASVSASAPPADDALGKIVGFLRSHRWARLGLSGTSVVLLAVAVGMLGYPLYTNLYQGRVQSRLDNQLASPELQQAYRSGRIGTGDALTRLRIPSLDVDVVVVEGTTNSALRAGAGHYPQTALPCEAGNVGIAGHRTTYGRPFSNLDRMEPGDAIILETPIGSCTYRVRADPFIVAPSDVGVVAPTPESILTLTTCHPKNSAAQRLIVQATLEGPATET